MTCLEIATFARDIILAVAAIIGAIVARKGLNTWKRQLFGRFQYELSHRILVSLFRYRDAIKGVRNPWMSAYEMPHPPNEEAESMSEEEIEFYGNLKAYESRWEKVQEQHSVLYADLLESEAIWGPELKELFNVIFNLVHELSNIIRLHLKIINPETDEKKKEELLKIMNEELSKRKCKIFEIMYFRSDDSHMYFRSDDSDDYSKDFLAGIDKIETYLKPKLTH